MAFFSDSFWAIRVISFLKTSGREEEARLGQLPWCVHGTPRAWHVKKKKKRRRRGEILRTGRAPLEKASASGFTSVLDIHAHFLRGSCHFFSPSSREGNLIFLRQPTCAPTSVQQQPAQTPTRMPVPFIVHSIYLSVVVGKVAKQVRQRWKGYALIDNEHRLVRNSSSKNLKRNLPCLIIQLMFFLRVRVIMYVWNKGSILGYLWIFSSLSVG